MFFHSAGFALLHERWLLVPVGIFVAGGIGASLFWVQHNFEHSWHASDAQWSYVRAALKGSSYLRFGPLLQWFTGSIGLHHVHHLNPGIPNYHLDAARKAIPELAAIEPLSNDDVRHCYTHVFWDGARNQMVVHNVS